MIPFDFEYYKPSSYSEAVQMFHHLDGQGKQPLYLCGGTEIITMARLNKLYTEAVIDLKGIPECMVTEVRGEQVIFGAAIPLAQIEEDERFPLLSQTCSTIADHTSRCKITLGGNISGTIMYREAVLPLLLADGDVVIAGREGTRQVSIHEVFDQHMKLQKGEFVLQIVVPERVTKLPYRNEKKTAIDRIDYPLLTLAALKDENNQIKVAFSGICAFPFRSPKMELELNNAALPLPERFENALTHLPAPIITGMHGSAEYRKFVLQNTLLSTMGKLLGE